MASGFFVVFSFFHVNLQLPHTIFDSVSGSINTLIENIPHCGQLNTFGSDFFVILMFNLIAASILRGGV